MTVCEEVENMNAKQAKQELEFAQLLAARIMYQLKRQGLITIAGHTVDEVEENGRKANFRELHT